MATIVAAILFDYALDRYGSITVGEGSRRACEHAVRLAYAHPDSIVFFAARASPDPKWRNIPLGNSARRYMKTIAPDVLTTFREADTFNTFGEILSLARYLVARRATEHDTVLIAVKWWHAPRVRMLAHGIFAHLKLHCPVTVCPHWFRLTPKTFAHELGALPADWSRIRQI